MNAISALNALARIPSVESSAQRILIVDDEVHFRAAYKSLLAHEQRVIDEAANGQEALAKLADGKIDLVILDLRLPDISGLEIMEWLTARKIQTSVIVFSADKSINSAIHALRHRAFEFLRKDCDPDEMILAVERALNHVWRVPEPRPMWQRLFLYVVVLAAWPILIGGLLAATSTAEGMAKTAAIRS